ncbi:hypothetical protein FHK02_2464 [Spirosoma sp. LMG 31448]|uniref:Uncharacterized protein n=1 Tax=Spirosoma utsteinense TaxID=2585773 RepID=A0ABR6W250_9BACT|nr:hypothetical protein [Spirosoma utsteinense]MBC3790681.1 hypothetical protein [Spirosoma utsteinense]
MPGSGLLTRFNDQELNFTAIIRQGVLRYPGLFIIVRQRPLNQSVCQVGYFSIGFINHP